MTVVRGVVLYPQVEVTNHICTYVYPFMIEDVILNLVFGHSLALATYECTFPMNMYNILKYRLGYEIV